jgi:hypothetical protein
MSNFIYSPEGAKEMKELRKYEIEPFDFNAFNMSRSDLIKMSVE